MAEAPEAAAMRVAGPGEINGGLVDRFTFVHGAAGAAAYRYGASFQVTMVAAVLFEFAEREAKREFPRIFPNPTQDSLGNAVCDVLATAIGWHAARLVRKHRKARKA